LLSLSIAKRPSRMASSRAQPSRSATVAWSHRLRGMRLVSTPRRYVRFFWYRQSIPIDVGTGCLFHVSDQGRAGLFASCSDQPGGRYGGQMSQDELVRRREANRHPKVMNGHITEVGAPEKIAKLLDIPEGAGDNATDGGLGAYVSLKPFAQR
jgi:hypothetical protein